MDILSQILQALGYLLLLVVLVILWRKAFRPSEFRSVWRWLAAAWTMNLLGNIAWIVHDLVTGTALDTFSVVDVFYVLRYGLLGYVLWLYPAPLSRRTWLWVGGIMFVVNATVWLAYFSPAMALRGGDWTGFLGLALYPVLDAGVIAIAWFRVRATQQGGWGRFALLLFCAMASYGIANTVNLTEYVFALVSSGFAQGVFWLLTDVFLLFILLTVDLAGAEQKLVRTEA